MDGPDRRHRHRRCLGPGSSASQVDADNVAARLGVHSFATSVVYGVPP